MRNPLRRYYGRRDLHFVTFSCYRRRPYLGTRRARDQFVKVLDRLLRGLQGRARTRVRVRWKFPLIGYVVMPVHIHLLMGEPPRGDPSKVKVLQVLKQKVSRALRARHRKPLRRERFIDGRLKQKRYPIGLITSSSSRRLMSLTNLPFIVVIKEIFVQQRDLALMFHQISFRMLVLNSCGREQLETSIDVIQRKSALSRGSSVVAIIKKNNIYALSPLDRFK
jgi:REP element-mobilizing transposase RayT